MSTLVGRDELKRLCREALRSRSMILLGPRRVGKSSFLKDFEANPDATFRASVVDLQGAKTVEQFVERLVAISPPTGLISKVGAAVDRVEGVEVAALAGVNLRAAEKADPWLKVETWLQTAIRNAGTATVVVALDEMPWWLDALEEAESGSARTTLARLRYLRTKRGFEEVRWIFTGSVGLSQRAADWNASAELNDLDVVIARPLDPISGKTVFEVEALQAEPKAAHLAHKEAGGLPHWIRMIASRATAAAGNKPVTVAIVEQTIQSLLSPQMRHSFAEEGLGHFGRRYSAADERLATLILSHLAQTEVPVSVRGVITATQAHAENGTTAKQIHATIYRLVDEFYLIEENESVVFAVPLFRRWWIRWNNV